mgnify:FL=1
MNKDLTVGDPAKVLWKFCLPLFGSIIFQQLYNIADSFVAGKFIGENALAAVGNSYEITLIFIAFAFGCNIGCSVIVSQLFGAKKLGEMKTAVYTTFISSAVVCAALMLVGTLGCDGLLRLINTPENVFADSKLYLDIYILGLPFVFFYNVATGIFSALGDSKTPFIFLAASSTSNIFMDILFVTAFKMGVAGVAWATFLCQGVSCVLAVLFVLRRLRGVETDEKSALFSFPLFCRIAVIAVPSILQQSFISVGNIVIQGVINSFGSGVMAGYSASVKLNNLVITSLTTLGNGISNFTAQNIGASKMERVRSGFMQNLAASAAYSSGFFSSQYLPLSESIFISEAQVIRDIAAKESAVIVGRCADYILAGRDNTINVFVYAPRDVRVNRIMARHNLSEAEALKAISTSDKERGNHYFRYTDQKWGKAQNYDVCINSGLMGIEKTAEMLADMAKIEVRA